MTAIDAIACSVAEEKRSKRDFIIGIMFEYAVWHKIPCKLIKFTKKDGESNEWSKEIIITNLE